MAGHMAEFGAPGFVDTAARPLCFDKTQRVGGSSSISASPNTVRVMGQGQKAGDAGAHTHTHTQNVDIL